MTTPKFTLDVTAIEPKLKHPTIFHHFDHLTPGNCFVIHNDHDPKPLYYQLLAERGQCFKWTYLQNGPDIWLVEISKNPDNSETLASLSTADFRKAEVFKKFGLNFSCRGNQSLEDACNEKNINVSLIKNELLEASKHHTDTPNYQSWSLSLLIHFIKHSHHVYVRTHLPELLNICQFMNAEFNNQTLADLYQYCHLLHQEMMAHLNKEEIVLFPYILQLLKQLEYNETTADLIFKSVATPINMMMMEHESADECIAEIDQLILKIDDPIKSNMQFQIFCEQYNKFKDDLITHIHLENNILFPKAIELEKQLFNLQSL